MSEFSDYLVFADESGDHGLDGIDLQYPVFVLAFAIARKDDYVDALTPEIQRFKMKHFGHDGVILHERDIRRDLGPFAILRSPQRKDAFMGELGEIISRAPVTVVASVIDKQALKATYHVPHSPYDLALAFGLERIAMHLKGLGQTGTTFVTLEQRGRREDETLELEFRRVCDGENMLHEELPLKPVFASKDANYAGLQLADLVARPIGLKVLRPDQENRAYEIVETTAAEPNGGDPGVGAKALSLKQKAPTAPSRPHADRESPVLEGMIAGWKDKGDRLEGCLPRFRMSQL